MFWFAMGDSVEGEEEIVADACENVCDDFQGKDLQYI
jgi:hypothetical protein